MRANIVATTASVSAEATDLSHVMLEAGKKRLYRSDNGTIVFSTPEVLDQADLHEAILDLCSFAKSERRVSLIFNFLNVASMFAGSRKTLARILGDYLVEGSYIFDTYKKDKDYPGIDAITIENVPDSYIDLVNEGVVNGEAVVSARELCNTPANDLNPDDLYEYAKGLVRLGADRVIDMSFQTEAEENEPLGLVVGVNQGSERESQFIVLEYRGDDSTQDIGVVSIGKGVCFDTGGLSMKSSEGMLGMHHDMGGGAAALASLYAIIRRKVKVNVAVIVPAVENAVSCTATHPGDILTSMSGLTVEVGNTDAEGRLILADALTYAGKHYPEAKLCVDSATLTGAVGVALGSSYSGLFTTNDKLAEEFLAAAEYVNDPLWRLPIGGEFRKLLDSKVADLNNVQSGPSKNGGASIGASFLSEFAKKAGIDDRHVHVDIASRMKGNDGLSQGAGTRLLIAVIEGYAAKAA